MFSISLIGLDGVGKTTVAKQLEKSFPKAIKYIYMGDNYAARNYAIPSARWWFCKMQQGKKKHSNAENSSGADEGTLRNLNRNLNILKKLVSKAISYGYIILNGWYLSLVSYYFLLRRYVIVYDRHFYLDYFHKDFGSENGKRILTRSVRSFFWKHVLPSPDLVICLDARAEVAFKRKGEFTIEHLKKRRRQYLSLKHVIKNFLVVNADRKLNAVVSEVSEHLIQHYKKKNDNGRHWKSSI